MNTFSKKNIRQIYLKLMKHKGTPESIGRGTAVGLLIAFVVPFSMQMLIAFPLALLLKAAKLPALLFTWVSNPITIPLLYPVQCFVGGYLIGRPFSYESIRATSANLVIDPSFSKFMNVGSDILISFFAGGLLFGSISAIIGYGMMVSLVHRYRKRREQRNTKRPPAL